VKLNWMASLGVLLLAFPVNAEETLVLKTPMEKVSYGIGVDIARNFMRLGIKFDTDILVRGLRDSLTGEKLLLTEDDLRATMSAYQSELMQKQAEAIKIAAVENKKIGDAFLTGNKLKKDVVALPSGLQYQILTAGDGKKPSDTDTVECNYRATLINGTEIDSSYRSGQPGTFKVAGLITGWREALKLMPVGSKWRLFIPPELAYGERGAGRDIGPNAMLIFELELIAIKSL
jgi:FKBP-type peptidyl-prolyl cis-trans isomerase